MERQDPDQPEGAVKNGFTPLWIKMPRNLHSRSDVLAAGSDAVLVYLEAACLCFDDGSDGTIPARKAVVIGRTLLAHQDWNADRLARAIEACVIHGLLARSKNGTVTVTDWADMKPRSKSAEQKEEQRLSAKCPRNVREMSAESPPGLDPEKRREDQRREQLPPPTHPSQVADERSEQGGWVGGGDENHPGDTLRRNLGTLGVFSRSPAQQSETADRLAAEGCTEHDLEDLWAEARKGNDPPALMASFLRAPGGWKRVLEESRKAATPPLYEERGLITPGDPKRSVDPASVGLAPCPECNGVSSYGKHGVDHGPLAWAAHGWRPGQPPPVVSDPAAAKPTPPPKAKRVKPEATEEQERAQKLAALKEYAAKNGTGAA